MYVRLYSTTSCQYVCTVWQCNIFYVFIQHDIVSVCLYSVTYFLYFCTFWQCVCTSVQYEQFDNMFVRLYRMTSSKLVEWVSTLITGFWKTFTHVNQNKVVSTFLEFGLTPLQFLTMLLAKKAFFRITSIPIKQLITQCTNHDQEFITWARQV